MESESSFELITRIQSGDMTALNLLVARYRPRLVRWVTGRLGTSRDMADTEDIVQDVLISTCRNIESFDNQGEFALQGYLRRAVKNRLITESQRRRTRPQRDELSEDLLSAGQSPLQKAVGAEFLARYDSALEQLTEDEREGVIARLELGCSYKEIASLLAKPTAEAARMAVTRAVAKLATLLAHPEA